MSLLDSTISRNHAQWHGGGMVNASTLTVVNSTISGNSALASSGGILNRESGLATLRNATIVENSTPHGSGILVKNGALTIANTIVALNRETSQQNCGGRVISAGHNLDTDGTCVVIDDPSSIAVHDPHLGPLAQNGGPTQTHALQTGSAAIDAGDPETCSVADQRGALRLSDGRCDIGAHEYASSIYLPAVIN